MGMMFAINSRVAVRKICFKQKSQNVMVLPRSLFCFSTRWSGGRSLQLRTFFQSPGYIRTPSACYLVGLLTLLAVMLKYHFRDFVFTFWVAFIPISSYVIRIWVFMSFSTYLSLASCFGFCQFNLCIIGCQIFLPFASAWCPYLVFLALCCQQFLFTLCRSFVFL